MKETILVTGGAGFMGSHLAQALLDKQYKVVILDNLSGGYAFNVPEKAELIVGSTTDENLVNCLFEHYQFSYVYHLAAYAAAGFSHYIRSFNYTNNILGSTPIINACIKYKVKRLIFTSSMSVYGHQQTPFTEDMTPNPDSPYGIAKLAVEQDLALAKDLFGLDYVIFRPHSVYGSKQNIWDRYRNVIGIFMKQVLNNEPMTIYGNGKQIRAFSHHLDVVPVMVNALIRSDINGEIFNIGSDIGISVYELSRQIAKVIGKSRKYILHNVVYLPKRYEVDVAYSNHDKLIQYWPKYAPKISLKDGLEEMASWAISMQNNQSQSTIYWKPELTDRLPDIWRLPQPKI